MVRRGAFSRHIGRDASFVDLSIATFWHPEDEYRITHPVPGGDECTVLRFSSDLLRAALDALQVTGSDASVVRFPSPEVRMPVAGVVLERIAFCGSRRGDLMALEIEELSFDFLAAALRASRRLLSGGEPERFHSRGSHEYVMRVREVIARDFRSRLTLPCIAERVGCSPFHLSRIVRAVEAVSIHRMLMEFRLRYAVGCLLETPASISEIALLCGFSSQSHFGAVFRREFGMSPARFRRHPRSTGRRPQANRVWLARA